jgi:hypothetical protein
MPHLKKKIDATEMCACVIILATEHTNTILMIRKENI